MHRRGAGIGAIKNKTLAQARYKDKGSELASDQLNQLSRQLDAFKSNLEEFTGKHQKDIKRNPEFRRQFQEMCAAIGVDPLASGKGFWAEMLGVGDFYYELGVQIVEVCIATAPRNGGLISLDELLQRLTKSRGRQAQEITGADVLTAIKKLKVLGNGFSTIPMGKGYLIQSVPGELTMDHTEVLEQAQGTGFVTVEQLHAKLGWTSERIHHALDFLMKEGLSWIDDQVTPVQYWFPSLCVELVGGS